MAQTQNIETISPAESAGKHEKKLLDRARDALLEAGFEREAAGRYVDWMLRYILFHNKRHPLELGAVEIDQYLSGPAFAGVGGQEQRVEAERALKFLYQQVLLRIWPRELARGRASGDSRPPAQASGAAGRQGSTRGSERGSVQRARYRNGQDPTVPLLKRLRNALRVGQYALETEKSYSSWAERYLAFHRGRAAEDMGGKEVEQFLTHLAADRELSAKSQKQALNALAFLYQTVLGIDLGQLMPVRGRHGKRVPVVMTRREVPLVLSDVQGGGGCFRLMSELMYGAGLRVRECCRMRIKDVDLERRQLVVRSGKGDQDRVTVLPERLVEPLRRQIARARRLHEVDLVAGYGRVWLPPALRRKYPNAEREFGWQYLEHIAQRCTEVDTGARKVDHILTRTLLPGMSAEVLARMAEDKPIRSVRVSPTADGAFQYDFA